MCGIAGIYKINGPTTPEDLAATRRMMDAQVHRGPNGEGIHQYDRVVLGHRRLSIIDLSAAGRQPMSNEDGTVWVTFNGEIYNFQELRDELINRGHRFRSKTDTEALVHGYEEWGMEGLLSRLRGMFAFALYDALPLTPSASRYLQIHRGPDGEGIVALGDRREALGVKDNRVYTFPYASPLAVLKVAGYFVQYFRKGWRCRGMNRLLCSDVLVVREALNLSVVRRIIIPEDATLFLGVMIRIRKFYRGSFQVKVFPEVEDRVVGKDERSLHVPDMAGHL